ncbi:MAG: DUF1559 domain-containing protein [Gemmataceae bacterium]|nr:DUF1559 domain-containing protein [Gemmataceae bacterium]
MRVIAIILVMALFASLEGCRSKQKPAAPEPPPKETKEKKETPVEPPPMVVETKKEEPAKNVKRNILQRTGTGKKLQDIHRALQMYANDNGGKLPPPYTKDASGKPLLSWRVRLLPYFEQDNLYRMFNQNEPWDSPTNKALLKYFPKIYQSSDDYEVKSVFKTTFLAPVANETVFPPEGGVSLAGVGDGASNTIFMVDADNEVATEWTRPVDLIVTKSFPHRGLGLSYAGGFMALFGDGSAQVIPAGQNSPANLWGLFTRAGGEAVRR